MHRQYWRDVRERPPTYRGETLHTVVHQERAIDVAEELSVRWTESAKERAPPSAENVLSRTEDDTMCMRIVASFDIRRPGDGAAGPAAETADVGGVPLTYDVTLCVIRAYSNNSFELQPGFSPDWALHGDAAHGGAVNTDGSGRYTFDLPDGTVYEYTLQNEAMAVVPEHVVEHAVSRADVKQNTQGKIDRKLELRRNLVGTEFTRPPYKPEMVRVHCYGEIVLAAGFRKPSVYVEYQVQLPDDRWDTSPPGETFRGMTHMTTLQNTEYGEFAGEPVAAFSFPLHFDFIYESQVSRRNTSAPVDDAAFSGWPVIYFTVKSMDYWNRNRTHGYGHVAIPPTPGQHVFNVPTWKPKGRMRDAVQDFYVGGSPEIDQLEYVAYPTSADVDSHRFNKFGFATQAAGVVKLRLHVMTQVNMKHPMSAAKARLRERRIEERKRQSSMQGKLKAIANMALLGVRAQAATASLAGVAAAAGQQGGGLSVSTNLRGARSPFASPLGRTQSAGEVATTPPGKRTLLRAGQSASDLLNDPDSPLARAKAARARADSGSTVKRTTSASPALSSRSNMPSLSRTSTPSAASRTGSGAAPGSASTSSRARLEALRARRAAGKKD